jgi:hypothetical protein
MHAYPELYAFYILYIGTAVVAIDLTCSFGGLGQGMRSQAISVDAYEFRVGFVVRELCLKFHGIIVWQYIECISSGNIGH